MRIGSSKKPLRKIEGIINQCSNTGFLVGAGALVCLTAIIAAGVFARYVLNSPLFFVDEMSGYLLVMVAYWGISYTTHEEGHVKIDMVTRRLPQKIRERFGIITMVLESGIFFLIIYFTIGMFFKLKEIGQKAPTVTETPLVIPYGLMIGGFLMAFLMQLAIIVSVAMKRARSN